MYQVKESAHLIPGYSGYYSRQLTDLLGSLCDLTSGSGDKGTPIIYIKATLIITLMTNH